MDTVILSEDVELKESSKKMQTWKKRFYFCGVILIVCLIVCAIFLGLYLRDHGEDKEAHEGGRLICGVDDEWINWQKSQLCHEFTSCNITMIESIPENLTYPEGSPSHPSIFNAWLKLLDEAQSTIYIASSYWSLRSDDVPIKDPSSWQGEVIFNKLIEAGKRGDG